ncbi:MAG: hypothetical protein ABIK95_10610 [Acidobacteriota bacterium]|nr:hypothetical protein [Acidobacteriota bacterium]MBU4496253.1 hypothetical protein [Acidobacteriota bacterium]
MNNTQKIASVIKVLCVIGFLLTIFDFLALHDIFNEYVSLSILKSLNITLSGELPDWIATKGEWGIVRINYLFRFAFFIFCAVMMSILVSKLQTKTQE